jgi:Mg2+ and Co2+ transporter CorA
MSEDELPKIHDDDPKTEPSMQDLLGLVLKRVEDFRSDVCTHFDKLQSDVAWTKKDVASIKSAQATTANQVAELAESHRRLSSSHHLVQSELDALRTKVHRTHEKAAATSNASLEHDAAIGHIIGEVSQLKERQGEANEAIGAMVEEFGVEGKVRLGRSLPPGVHRTPTLVRMSRDNKGALVAALVAALTAITDLILRFLGTHH